MTYILGITGGIGSGKTAATDRFAEHGIAVIDADVIAREVVTKDSEALEKISKHFESGILLPNGELDRKQLRQIIFANPTEKNWLEGTLHPLIRKQILQTIQQTQSEQPYLILSAPLLLENDLDAITDRVLVIDCNESVQIARTAQRDGSDKATVKNIIDSQISRNDRLSRADDIIDNNGTLEQLYQNVDNYHHQLVKQLT